MATDHNFKVKNGLTVESGNVIVEADGTYSGYATIGFGGTSNGSNRVFGHSSTGDGIYLASATGRHIHFRTNGSGSNTFRMTSSGEFQVGSTTIIDSSRNLTNIPSIRLTNETDAALTSTGHAFQVGPTSGYNVIIDNNEIMARHNGSASTLYVQNDGGTVHIGANVSTNLVVGGNIKGTTGNTTGKFAVKSAAVHNSYDFYNNGTTYLNGTTEVNAEFKISSSSSYITHFNYQDNGTNIISQANGGSTVIRNSNGNLFTLSGGGSLSVVGNVIAGSSSSAAILRAHYSDGSYMSLEGFGLVMNRASSYIRPSTDGDKTLYVGGVDASLDWASIRFRSTAGLYLNGTQFIDASRNLKNIGTINDHSIDSIGGFGFHHSSSTMTRAVGTGAQWIKVASFTSGGTKFITLRVVSSGDNTTATDVFLISVASYGMPANILKLPSTKYNTPKLTEVRTKWVTGATYEIWIKVSAITTSVGYLTVSMNDSGVISTLSAGTEPTVGSADTTLVVSDTDRNNYTIQASKTISAESGFAVGSNQVIDSSSNLTNIGTISSGAITSSGQVSGTSLQARNDSGYGTVEVGGSSGAFIDLKKPATDDYDVRIVSDAGTGGRIQSNGVFDIDAAGDITLDADGGDIYLKDNGVSMASFTTGAATFAGTVSSGAITSSGKITVDQGSHNPGSGALIDNTGLVVQNNDGNMDLLSYDDNSTVANNIGFGRFSAANGALIHKFGITHWVNTGSQGSNTGDKLAINYGTNKNPWSNSELFSISTSGKTSIAASTSTSSSSSLKLHVGTINNTSSGAIAQFGGFIRASDYYILHASAGSTDAIYIDYNGDDMDITAGEGTYSGKLRADGYKIHGTEVITSARSLTNINSLSLSSSITLNNNQRIYFKNSSGTSNSFLYRAGGNATRFEYADNAFIFDAASDTDFEIRQSGDAVVFKVDVQSTVANTSVYTTGNFNAAQNIQTGSTTRITNAGNLINIGSITASGNVQAQNATFTGTGDVTVKIIADTDNVTETDNPTLGFSQDGNTAGTQFVIGLEGNADTVFPGSIVNAPYIHGNVSAAPVQIANKGKLVADFDSTAANAALTLTKFSNITGTNGSTILNLKNYMGSSTTDGDLSQQKSFIDFQLLDSNANEVPQVRIGAEVGEGGDANSQTLEGSGAFVVYTNDSDSTSGDAGASLTEKFRVAHDGTSTFTNNVVIGGNLTVNGTQTTLNTATLQVEDKNIVLNYGTGDTSGSANGAGITIQDAINSSTDATMLWNASSNRFDFSNKINIQGDLEAYNVYAQDYHVLNAAGTGWHEWATRSDDRVNLSVHDVSANGTITISSGASSKITFTNSGDSDYNVELRTAHDYDGFFRVVDGGGVVRFAVGRDNHGYLGGTGGGGGNKVFHDGYHPNADKWTTARTITLTGMVDGSVSWDGSGNATLNTVSNHIRSLGTQVFTAGGGSNNSITTSALISEMEGDGAFDSYSSVFKTSWSYASNDNLSDAGRFTETAGTSWITWTDNASDTTRGNITALAIAPNTGGSAGKVFIYNDQGSSYAPGWREVWTSTSDGTGSGLDADLLDGQHGSHYLNYNNLTNTPTSLPANGGNADTVDNLHASSFLRSDTSDDMTGTLTIHSGGTNSYGKIRGYGNDNHFIVIRGQVSTGQSTLSITGAHRTTFVEHAENNDTTGWYFVSRQSGNYTEIARITRTGGIHLQGNKVWHEGNDGTGSGLDADTVDNIQASSFLRSDAADTFTGNLTSGNNNWIRFAAANATDTNDGKIGAGVFGSGLNIVGAQTSAGTGRQVRIWGDLIDSSGAAYLLSNENISTNSITVGTTTDSSKITFPDKNVSDNPTGSGDKRQLIAMGNSGAGGMWQTTGRGGIMLASADDSLILASGDVGRGHDPDAGGWNPNPDDENIYLLTDSSIVFRTNLQTVSSYKEMSFDPNGDLAVSRNISASGTITAQGNMQHTGLTMTSGTDIDQLYTASQTLTITTSYQDTGINGSDLATGTYIVQLYAYDSSVGGAYDMYYSGVMSWYAGNTNDTATDEIVLHRAGHASVNDCLFLRVRYTVSSDTDDLKLQIKGNYNASGSSTYTFKFRRMI